jgi:hypothetical protein
MCGGARKTNNIASPAIRAAASMKRLCSHRYSFILNIPSLTQNDRRNLEDGAPEFAGRTQNGRGIRSVDSKASRGNARSGPELHPGYGRIAGLNLVGAGAYSSDERAPLARLLRRSRTIFPTWRITLDSNNDGPAVKVQALHTGRWPFLVGSTSKPRSSSIFCAKSIAFAFKTSNA